MGYTASMSEQVEPNPDFVLPHSDGRIVATAGVCGGRLRIRGTRMTVANLLAGLAAGDQPGDIITDFPEISHEDITAALRFAAEAVDQYPVAAE
jgi:uncharacterized protein (DUF433 family)